MASKKLVVAVGILIVAVVILLFVMLKLQMEQQIKQVKDQMEQQIKQVKDQTEQQIKQVKDQKEQQIKQVSDQTEQMIKRSEEKIFAQIKQAEEKEDGLYRIRQVIVHIDGNDFVGNDDGGTGYYAPEPYVRIRHNGKEILLTKHPQDKWDCTWECSVDLAWKKGDKLEFEVWDKDLSDDDCLFTGKWDKIVQGTLKAETKNGSYIELTLEKIK